MTAQVHGGGIPLRFAGHAPFRSVGEGQQLLLLRFATGHARQCERSAHDLQPAPAIEATRVRRFRKLGFQERAELRGVVQFGQTAPVLLRCCGWFYR